MDGKKISFGFSKVTKKPVLQLSKTPKQDESSKVELIKCLEGQQIKLVEEQEKAPLLVIRLKDGGKTSAALASLAKRRAVLLGEDDGPADDISNVSSHNNTERNEEAQTLDKRAESEILSELQARNDDAKKQDLVLPVVKPDELPLDGAKESTLDDYESVPIGQYGWAMLRGMGAVEPPKSEPKFPVDSGPMQRPPGLGLGADKALKPKALLEQPDVNEKLEIKKQAFVRILAGKHKDCYGQIEGFDHERGTIIVKLAIGNSKHKFQEFLCQPVSKKEYAQYSKCINKTKYEEYKKLENEQGQVIYKKEKHAMIKNEDSARDVKKHQSSKQIRTEISDLNVVDNLGKRLKSDSSPETSSRNTRYQSRSRSRSLSRTRNNRLKRRHDSFNDHKKAVSKSEIESDSSYERSNSHTSIQKKKHKYRSSSNSDIDKHYKRDKKKKSKKKSKKSKSDRRR